VAESPDPRSALPGLPRASAESHSRGAVQPEEAVFVELGGDSQAAAGRVVLPMGRQGRFAGLFDSGVAFVNSKGSGRPLRPKRSGSGVN
jgi:hypothetical protein